MKFIFIEDRNYESGHGWRDLPHRFTLGERDVWGVNGSIKVFVSFDEGDGDSFEEECGRNPGYSYAWICPEEYYLKHKHLQDNIRTIHITKHHPKFKGVADMESHFEFHMTPTEMRKHLFSLGFTEIKRN